MRTAEFKIEDKIDQLLVCLEKDIEHVQKSLSNLDELRSMVIKRDNNALSRLLEDIKNESDNYRKHENKRQLIRSELAKYFNWSVKDTTLSKIEAIVPEEKKAYIIQTRAKLKSLVRQLQKEYSSTAMLLSECNRFNKLLLKSIFNFGNTGAVVYNANGTTKEQTERAFVNLQF